MKFGESINEAVFSNKYNINDCIKSRYQKDYIIVTKVLGDNNGYVYICSDGIAGNIYRIKEEDISEVRPAQSIYELQELATSLNLSLSTSKGRNPIYKIFKNGDVLFAGKYIEMMVFLNNYPK